MIQDNAALKPQAIPSPSRGIHLVYSRSRQETETIQTPEARPVRKTRAMAPLSLGAAAISAPIIWVGHAILGWLRIL